MQTRNRFADDMARLSGGMVGLMESVRREVRTLVQHQLERLLGDMDLVTREEFDTVQAMAAKAREEQEAMAERLSALESRLKALESRPETPPTAPEQTD